MYPRCCRPPANNIVVNYSTSCNLQSSVPEDGQNNCRKHVELTGIINKPLLLQQVGCLYYLYQWCTVKQISDNEIYLLIKYIKSVLWRAAKPLSYIEDARCLKDKVSVFFGLQTRQLFRFPQLDLAVSDDEKAACNAFRNVATGFLGNKNPSNSGILWKIL